MVEVVTPVGRRDKGTADLQIPLFLASLILDSRIPFDYKSLLGSDSIAFQSYLK